MRKIIQIQAVGYKVGEVSTSHLLALADDGTVWTLADDPNDRRPGVHLIWRPAPPLPQN